MPPKSPFVIMLSGQRARGTDETCAAIYVAVSRSYPRKDCSVGEPGLLANDIIAARLDTPRQIVSKWRQRFFAERLPGLDEAAARRTTGALFPPASSLRSRHWLASCPSAWACPWRGGRSPTCGAKSSPEVSSRRSAAQRSGDGSARMLCVLGVIAAGYSRAIRSLPPKPVRSWTFIITVGEASLSTSATSSSPPMRRPAFKRGLVSTQPCRLLPAGRSMSSTNIVATAPGPISPLGTSIAPSCLVAVSASRAAPALIAWSPKLCSRSLTVPLDASSGSSTIRPSIAASAHAIA